ncbi:MAG: hypothetical protein IPJ77_16250 [Planctomycetes bacterium]|nr:hypothetical protein [Planctomycetota bacterium]
MSSTNDESPVVRSSPGDRVHLGAAVLQVDEREEAVRHVHQRDPQEHQEQADAVEVDVRALDLAAPPRLLPAAAEEREP